MTINDVLTALHRERLLPQLEDPAAVPTLPDSTWYINFLLGIMGWIGGVLIVGSFAVAIGGFLREKVVMLVFAVLFITAAWFCYRKLNKSVFMTQFALAASMAGQFLFLFSILENRNGREVALYLACLQIALVCVMPNFLHRFLSTCFAVIAIWFAASSRQDFLPSLAEAPVWLLVAVALGFVLLAARESAWMAAGKRALAEPVMLALGVTLLVTGAPQIAMLGKVAVAPSFLLAGLFAAVLVGWVFWQTRAQPVQFRLAAALAVALVAMACWRAPGVIAGVLVMLVAFSRGRRVLMCAAMLATTAYLCELYYQLGQTLAEKSLALALTGALLLLVRWAVKKFWPPTPQVHQGESS